MRILPITGVASDAESASLDQDSVVDWDPTAFGSFLVDMEQEEAVVVAIDPFVPEVDLVLEHAVAAVVVGTLPSVVVASVAVDATFAVVEVLVVDLLDDIRVENHLVEVASLDTLVPETVASFVPVAAVVVAAASFAFFPAVVVAVAHRMPAFVAAVAAAVVVAVAPTLQQRLPPSASLSASFSFSVAPQ